MPDIYKCSRCGHEHCVPTKCSQCGGEATIFNATAAEMRKAGWLPAGEIKKETATLTTALAQKETEIQKLREEMLELARESLLSMSKIKADEQTESTRSEYALARKLQLLAEI